MPGLFGVTLIGEGFSKIINGEWTGIISIIIGIAALGFAIVAYEIFKTIKLP